MTLLDKTNTLVIVPAYNEQDSIVSVIEEIKTTGFPFVVIDDGSTDETRSKAIAAGARTISLPFNSGVGGALKCGFRFAIENGFKAVVQFDADGQHPSDQICNLVAHANATDSVMVIGSRFKESRTNRLTPSVRRTTMRFLSYVASRLSNHKISDTTSGFRLISDPILSQFAGAFPNYYLGDTFESVIFSLKEGYQVGEISVEINQRVNGTSTASNLHASKNLLKILVIAVLGFHFDFGKKTRSKEHRRIFTKQNEQLKVKQFFRYLFLYFTPYAMLIHLRFAGYQFKTLAGDDIYSLGLSQIPGGFGSNLWNSILEQYFGKWRPITQFVISALLDWFSGDFWKYQLLNEFLLATVGTLIAVLVVNIHPSGKIIAWFAGSFIVITRFNLFNVLQILGIMENIALMFCLLTLISLRKYIKNARGKYYVIANIFFFASIHSHERYIFLFPVIVLATFVFTEGREAKRIFLWAIVPCISLAFNFTVKVFIFHANFLTGGAAVPIDGSLSNIAWFFWRGMLNMFGYNSGPDYLSGRNAHSLGGSAIWVAVLWALPCGAVLLGALIKMIRKSSIRSSVKVITVPVSAFVSLLLSASITFRQEYRWLLSPFIVFVVMVVCSISYLFRSKIARGVVTLFIVAVGTVNGLYYARYAENTYFFMTQKLTDSINDQIFVQYKSELNSATFVVIDHGSQVFDWGIGGGLFFDVYGSGENTDIRRITEVGDKSTLIDLRENVYVFDYQWDKVVQLNNEM